MAVTWLLLQDNGCDVRHTSICIYLFAALFICTAVKAGPPPSCITATVSGRGDILVLDELTYDSQDETAIRHIQTSTYRIFQRMNPVYEDFRLDGPGTYWSDALWSVVFKSSDKPFSACSHVLATEDGEFLVIFGSGYLNGIALNIYRRRDHPFQSFGDSGPDYGVLVKAIYLTELWPKERIPKVFTDETPAWFSDGVFSFSDDHQALLYKPAWRNAMHIDLQTGKITAF